MVKIKAFDGYTFKPQVYAQILHKNMEYLQECQLIRSFNTEDFLNKGLLHPQNDQFIYLYQQQFRGFITLGLLAELSLIEYAQKKIKKHEKTLIRPHLNENTYGKQHVGPVIVGHSFDYQIDQILLQISKNMEPFAIWQTVDGRKHKLWRVSELSTLYKKYEDIQKFYILDGHHRFEAALAYLLKLGEQAKQKHKWIQGLIYSTKYIRVYPQFRKLIHEDHRSIIRSLMGNDKLSIKQIENYDYMDNDYQLVLLHDGKFFQVYTIEEENQKASAKTGTQKLDDILRQTFEELKNKSQNPIKFVPSIMFNLNDLSVHNYPVFLVKCPQIHSIFQIANQDQFLPPKSTWLQPKPCLHMVIRLPN